MRDRIRHSIRDRVRVSMSDVRSMQISVRMARPRFEQFPAHGDGDETEEAGAVAEADDPVLEGFVHQFELEFDGPGIVAVEDGEGLLADEAVD